MGHPGNVVAGEVDWHTKRDSSTALRSARDDKLKEYREEDSS